MTVENRSILYLVGVGPGDPELLTLKAVRLIKDCDVLFVPVRQKGSEKSMALDIVRQAVDLAGKKMRFLHFPMVRGAEKMQAMLSPAVDAIEQELQPGQTGVFITLGCSTVFSTAGNLFLAMKDRHIDWRFLPGVSSINGAAAASGMPLVYSEEKLAVLPATYSMDRIESCMEEFETIVLMKVHSNMAPLAELLEKKGLLHCAFLMEKATSAEEAVRRMADIPDGYKPNYMSTVIVKTKTGD